MVPNSDYKIYLMCVPHTYFHPRPQLDLRPHVWHGGHRQPFPCPRGRWRILEGLTEHFVSLCPSDPDDTPYLPKDPEVGLYPLEVLGDEGHPPVSLVVVE